MSHNKVYGLNNSVYIPTSGSRAWGTVLLRSKVFSSLVYNNYKEKSYERFRQELLAWKEITDLDKTKQGIAIALSLPEDHD